MNKKCDLRVPETSRKDSANARTHAEEAPVQRDSLAPPVPPAGPASERPCRGREPAPPRGGRRSQPRPARPVRCRRPARTALAPIPFFLLILVIM